MSLGLFYEWTYAGVDHSIEGNGGPECIGFIPTWQKILETSIVCPIAIMEIIYGLRNISLPVKQVNPRSHFTTAKSIMLVAHCLVFGIELGFKFASRQMIWILNTCHVNTMLQIYLLAAPPSRFLTAMFRLHVHTLAGAVIAILLPVLNTRLLPFEHANYFLQHSLMMVVLYFLLSQGGSFTTEATYDFSWAILAHGIIYIYYWIFIQGVSIYTQVNLNNIVCPAVTDPFSGRWYRMAAALHQTFCILLFGKMHTLIAEKVGLKPPVEKDEIAETGLSNKMIETNGFGKLQ